MQPTIIPARYVRTKGEILVERKALFGEATVTPELMFEHGTSIQLRIGNLLKDHSPIFWLALLRKRPIQLTNDPLLQVLIRWQLSTLFWLYGDHSKKDYSVTISGELLILKDSEAIERLAGEILAFATEIVNVPSAFRRLSKGATFRLGTDGSLLTSLPKRLEEAAGFYDKRRSETGDPLQHKGLGIPTPKTRGTWSVGLLFEIDGSFREVSKIPIRFYEENTIGDIEYATGGVSGFEEPNFMRSAWDLSGWIAYLNCFRPELQKRWGLSLEEFIEGFRALDSLILKNYTGRRGVTCHEIGLLPLPYDELREHFESCLLTSCDPAQVSDVFSNFCRLLEHDSDNLADYDFFSSHSAGVLLRAGEAVFLDVSQIGHKIEQSLSQLNIDDKMQFEKGASFEKVVSDALRRNVDGVTYPIADSQELFLEGSGTPFAEADVYVAKGEILFIIDCKACGVSRGYLKGVTRPAQSRWAKVRRWLAESDARALKLANAPRGKNYALDPHIKVIIPIVCSSVTEYFWELDSQNLLTGTIPRVCTIGELTILLQEAEQVNWRTKPFAVPVKW